MQLILKDAAGKIIADENYFFQRTKDLLLQPTSIVSKVKQIDGSCEVTLSSSKLAKDVFIEIPLQGARFSDNFFDLLPGETKKVVITSPLIKKSEKLEVNVKHIRDTY